MTRNTIKAQAIGIVAALALTSCNDYLDITPEGQVSRDDLLSTDEGVEDAMYGVYSELREADLYGSRLTFRGLDVMSQQFSSTNNSTIAALGRYEYDNSSVQGIFESIWTKAYNTISNINSVLGSPLVADATTYPECIYRGEALGLRAFLHFDLVRIFCEQITQNEQASGIPYATEFSLDTPDYVTERQAYQNILDDLLLSEQLLSCEDGYKDDRDYMRDRQTHFNLHAVRATLARVYLTMGWQEKALEYAEKVINNSPYTLLKKAELTDDLCGMLYKQETIFGVYYDTFWTDIVKPYLWQTTTGLAYNPRDDIEDLYTGNDRRSVFVGYTDAGTQMRFQRFTDKYKKNSTTRPGESGWIPGINMIRLPEMYLIAAECLLGDDPKRAEQVFGAVLDSRDATKATTGAFSISDIDAERYREFYGEGQTFFNLKRRNLSFSSYDGSSTIQPTDGVFVVPIPEIEDEYRN